MKKKNISKNEDGRFAAINFIIFKIVLVFILFASGSLDYIFLVIFALIWVILSKISNVKIDFKYFLRNYLAGAVIISCPAYLMIGLSSGGKYADSALGIVAFYIAIDFLINASIFALYNYIFYKKVF